ncbi:xylulokinase [Anaerolineales bacterium]|nr:xylulokinase [Anaerolineales bacterium]
MQADPRFNKYVLAIDLGSGGPKVGLVNQQGTVVASDFSHTPLQFLPNGGAEQDPNEWWQAVTGTAKSVIRKSRVSSDEIVAVAVTSQWSVIVAVDENGEALMNAISWLDTRGAKYNHQITGGFPSVSGYQAFKLIKYVSLAGGPPTQSGVDSMAHILFIKNERPEVYRRTYKFLEPMDYINMKLTGKAAATQSTVFAYLLTDNRKLDQTDYDPWLLKMSGVDREKLPDILPIDGIIGPVLPSVAEDLGLSPNTKVVVGTNDNCTSAIGTGAIFDFDAAAVLGTSGHLAVHIPFKKTDVIHQITTMPSAIKGRYLFQGDLGNTCRVLDSYLRNMVLCSDAFFTGNQDKMYEKMSRIAAEVPPGSEGVLFLPWLNGSYAPSENPTARGGFINLSNKSTRAHMTRAVLEGIAMNWRWLREPTEKMIGRKFEYWRLTGGGALSDVWAQIMADVVGIPMRQQAEPRTNNLLGVAFLAFNHLGVLSLEDIPRLIKFKQIFEPQEKNRAVYEKMFKQFLAGFNNLKPITHALNK